ncbi:SH3 domain-containing protein [Methylocystis sp. IM3]|jgi:uncharacterized protein YraI|uniref:SH3 domain-containing protein n=1 Tax=unclassified Methylocystis TaxID=2625913 RepID=UPI0030FC15D9
MRKSSLWAACAAFAVVLSGSSAIADTLASIATIHKGPGNSYPVLGRIPVGGEVDVVNCNAGWKANWCHVKYQGIDGFVNANTLAPSGNDVIVAPIVTNNAAYMRSGPGQSYSVVGVLTPNSQVDVKKCTTTWLQGWCKVDFDGLEGWVHGSLLQRQGALMN